MNDASFDVIVVGCGGAGSATTWWLARQGVRVLAIDRFDTRHTHGSSHGTERIVRLASPDPLYVTLAQEALPMWRDLNHANGGTLLRTVGGVDTGDEHQIERLAQVCDETGVRYEWLVPDAAASRFPGLRFRSRALVQPDAGCVNAQAAVDAFADDARAHGAVIHRSERVRTIDQHRAGVRVATDRGSYRADSVVVATGAWAEQSLAGLVSLPPITVTQEQVAFFRPTRAVDFPTFIDRRATSCYGLPTPDGLVKIAEHYTGPVVDPDTRSGEVEPRTWERLLTWVRENVPGVDPDPIAHTTCLYASTPDEDFVIDRVGRITVGVGLGGHGFKFLPVLGRRIAEMATGTPWVQNPFGCERRTPRAGHK